MSSLSAAKPARPIILYRSPLSGHSHRVQMFMSLLSLPVKIIDVDLPNRAHKCPEFLATNPFGQVPVIDDNGLVLYDSNAILAYLARTYDNGRWMPSNMQGLIGVQQWFSLAAGPIYDDPCAARLVKLFGAPIDHERAMTISNNCSRSWTGTSSGSTSPWATDQASPMWLPTATSPTHPKAASAWIPIRSCALGLSGSKPCPASCQ